MALKFRRPCNDEDVEKLVEIFTRGKKKCINGNDFGKHAKENILFFRCSVW